MNWQSLPAVTLDHEPIELMGNIEFPEEGTIVLQRGGEGVGLYRTEFLYMDVNEEPSEEDHYNAYMKAIEVMGNKRPITIRTVDLGADKFTQARSGEPERNPFFGFTFDKVLPAACCDVQGADTCDPESISLRKDKK